MYCLFLFGFDLGNKKNEYSLKKRNTGMRTQGRLWTREPSLCTALLAPSLTFNSLESHVIQWTLFYFLVQKSWFQDHNLV